MVDFRSLNKTYMFYTVCIYLNHFAFGITSNIVWSALVDLSYIYDSSNEAINYLMTFGSLGYLIGSLSGYLYQWVNRQLTIVLLCAVLAITTAFIPHYGQLWVLFVAMVANGIGGGTWDSNNNVWLVEMWPAWNAPIIQASQFMYGLGTIVGPIVVSPYVHGENTNTTQWSPDLREKQLTFPFGLTAVIQLLIPSTLLLAFVIARYRPNQSSGEQAVDYSTEVVINHQAELTETAEVHMVVVDQSTVANRWIKLVLMALCLAMYDAAEIAYFYFSPSMMQFMKPIEMPADDAARVASILSAAYTVGRLCTAFISIKLTPDVIIAYHFAIIVAGQTILYLGRDSQTTIIVGTVVLGYGFSAMWPAILAFTDRYLKLTNRAGSLLFFFAGVVSIFTPFIIGRFLNDTPTILFFFEGCYLATSLALFIVLRMMIGFGRSNPQAYNVYN